MAAATADLARQATGQTVFGWLPIRTSGVERTVFVNARTGYRVLSERRGS